MKSLIKGRVINILDDEMYVIDKGFNDGLNLDDILSVYAETEKIHDREGNEIEGLHKSIGYLQIYHVQDKISLASISSSSENYYFQINTTFGEELILGSNHSQFNNQINIGDFVYVTKD
ncbi:MAG: hypothetical protein HeimC2_00560 [Candidatus Heimdallarchaeota archaeon LC_2]|nr:MAG: hypothetical protein HeimC2_00560 [Candidatus Heimdallarchaeota archaeon LC_2]